MLIGSHRLRANGDGLEGTRTVVVREGIEERVTLSLVTPASPQAAPAPARVAPTPPPVPAPLPPPPATKAAGSPRPLPQPEATRAPAPVEVETRPEPPRKPVNARAAWGWTLVATGTAALAAAVPLHIIYKRQADDAADLWDRGTYDSAKKKVYVAAALYGVAAAALGSGLYLALTELLKPHDAPSEGTPPTAILAPFVGPTGAGGVLTLPF